MTASMGEVAGGVIGTIVSTQLSTQRDTLTKIFRAIIFSVSLYVLWRSYGAV